MTLRTILNLAAGGVTCAVSIPGLPPLLTVGLGALAGFLAGWANLEKPASK